MDSSSNDTRAQTIEIYRNYLLNQLESFPAKLIAKALKTDGVFSAEQYNLIRPSDADATSKLLDCLVESSHTKPNWYGSFTQALIDDDLKYIVDHIEGRRIESDQDRAFLQILEIRYPEFIKEFDPESIMQLHGRVLFNNNDIQEIQAQETQRKKVYRFLTLLTKLPDWYDNFIVALQDRDCGDLSKWSRLLNLEGEDINDTFKHWLDTYSSSFYDELEPNDVLDGIRNLSVAAKNLIRSKSKREDRVIVFMEELVKLPYGYYKHLLTELKNAKHGEKYSNLLDDLEPTPNSPPRKSNKNETDNVMTCSGGHHEDADNPDLLKLPLSMQSLDLVGSTNGQLQESVRNFEKPEVDILNQENDSLLDPISRPNNLILRDYQEELAAPALQEKNCMIVAPTGSGKTFVALKVCLEHMKKQRDAKIIFLVPRVVLVQQQYSVFKRFLGDEPNTIFQVTGESSSRVPVNISVERNIITIMTAQILINLLNDELLKIAEITLLIFDECHHAVKNDPYSMIMKKYMDEQDEDPTSSLPQVIGLTASPGMGNAKNMKKAEEAKAIKTLMATLDVTIPPVQSSILSLVQYQVSGNDETIIVERRSDDPFRKKIKQAMEKIENLIKKCILDKQSVLEGRIIYDLHATPGSQDYESWVVDLLNKSKLIKNKQASQQFMAYAAHLKEYNTSLMLNDHVGSGGANEYIENKLFDGDERIHVGEVGKRLHDIYEQHKPPLHNGTIPLLKELEKKLTKEFTQLPKSRCIIFVKTRAIAKALLKCLSEEQQLTRLGLNPKQLTGAGARSESFGQTKRGQEDTLQAFKEGKCKVIVATSVAEEGLDMKGCNLIIRYNYSTNEVGLVQIKGRGRAENSKMVMLAYGDSGHVKKERENEIRVELTHKILEDLQKIDPFVLKSQIRDIQKDLKDEREFERIAQSKQKKPRNTTTYKLSCLWCKKQVTTSQQLRHINEQHHVVVDPKFSNIAYFVEVPEGSEGKEIGDEEFVIGKILCRDPECRRHWGLRMRYKSCPISVLKIANFLITDDRGYRAVKKQWRDVPFNHLEEALSPRDLKLSLNGNKGKPDELTNVDSLGDEV